MFTPPHFVNLTSVCVYVCVCVCVAGGDSIPLRRLTVDQVALLLEGLDLGDYVTPFRAAGVNGNTLHFSETRDELKEDKGVDISSVGFRVLRAAVEEYAPSGVPTALLEEARGRVQQREQATAPAPTPAPSPAPAPAPTPTPAPTPAPAPAPVRDEAAFARLKAQAPQKVALSLMPS